MLEVAKYLDGYFNFTLYISDSDFDSARSLIFILSRKAGPLLANFYPTGVEVCYAMVHGGLFPASTDFGVTSPGEFSNPSLFETGVLRICQSVCSVMIFLCPAFSYRILVGPHRLNDMGLMLF